MLSTSNLVPQTALYGLLGYPLSHSFSKQYFTQKFAQESIQAHYELFEIPDIQELIDLLTSYPHLEGLNVTIPYKQSVIPYLTRLAYSAEKVGAVNVIKIEKDRTLTGHNTDYIGFAETLKNFIPPQQAMQALVLGNGGAGKAVEAVLRDLDIPHTTIARQARLTFEDLTPAILQAHLLIVNTTPLGMYPAIETCPSIPYHALTPAHYVYDLVYNPAETLFLQKAKAQGAKTMNGLAMLYAQAEASWQIFMDKL